MGGVKVFDPARDPRGRRVPGWHEQIAALTFDREGLRVLGIDWATGALTSADPVDGDVRRDRLLPVTDSRRWPRGDFAFSPDGGRLAAPTRRDRTVVGVWDVALGRPVATLRGSGGPVTAVAFGPDGRSLATAAAGGPNGRPIVTLWHLASGRAIRTFEAGPDPVEALAFSGDGRRLAAGGGDEQEDPGWVTAWDAETGAVLGTLDRVGLVMSLAFHPDGARLAVADFGGVEGPPLGPRGGHADHPSGAGGASVASSSPRTGSGWRRWGTTATSTSPTPRTGDEVLVLRSFGPPAGGGGFTPRLAFSPDGSRIAANAVDGPLNLWDLGPASGLAVEPEAGDLAGWLRRSRALAERGDAAGRRGRLGAGPRHQGRRCVPLDRARRVALSPRRLVTGTGRPGAGHGGPARRPRALGRPRPVARAPRPDGGVGDGRWRRPGPSASDGSPAPPTTRRPPRPWPSCSRMPTPPRAGPSSGPT